MTTEEEVIQTVGKFQLIKGYPPAAPGKCVGCGKFSGEFIDFGFDIDYYGAVYFCRDCFTEGCHLFGYHSDEKMKAFAKELGEANSRVLDLTVENEGLKNALAATDVLSKLTSSISLGDDSSDEVVQPTGTDSSTDDRQSAGDAKTSSRREKGSTKQSDESGPSGLRNNDPSLTDAGIDI